MQLYLKINTIVVVVVKDFKLSRSIYEINDIIQIVIHTTNQKLIVKRNIVIKKILDKDVLLINSN